MSSSSQALIRHQEELSPGGCYLGAEATETNRQPIRLLEGNRWPNSRVYLKKSDRNAVLQGLCPNSILLLTSLNLRMSGLANSTTPLLLCKKLSPKPKKKGHRKLEVLVRGRRHWNVRPRATEQSRSPARVQIPRRKDEQTDLPNFRIHMSPSPAKLPMSCDLSVLYIETIHI